MARVSIVRTNVGMKPALAQAIDLIGGMGEYVRRTDAVMLKPNINGTEGITNVDLMEALIRMLTDFGVEKIIIAESTFGNDRMTDMFFAKTGYADLASRYDIPLINLNRSEAVDVKVKNPLVMESIRITKEVFEVDCIINVPVMKVHYATGITLALKNLKGLLVREEKRRFHETGLDKAIVDLNSLIKAALNIIDCSQCMERMGPRGGDMVDLNLLIAGEDRAETDYTGCLVMRHTLDEVKHLQLYIEHNGIDLSRLEILGERIEDVSYPFKKAKMNSATPKGFFVHNVDACSSCMNALLLSFMIYGKDAPHETHVYLGTKRDDAPLPDACRLAFGNCCDRNENYGLRIKGCPPYPFDLKNKLEQEY
ncbi:MAG: hypothetical protein CSYNP_03684 [Syntrophus sp. SKADARSKE-3]|nr:hypothetical protein [Syntrophus sp. SKADARSKE-3]